MVPASKNQGWMSALIALPIGAIFFVVLFECARLCILSIGNQLLTDTFNQNSFKDVRRQIAALEALAQIRFPYFHASMLSDNSTPLNQSWLPAPRFDSEILLLLSNLGGAIASRSIEAITHTRSELVSSQSFKAHLERRDSLLKEWQTLLVLIDDLLADLNRFKSAASRVNLSEEDLARYRDRFIELRIKTLAFIKIPHGADNVPFGFYTSGVLEGIPILNSISDDQSLETLRDEMRRAGGTVTIPLDAPDPKQYFLDTVAKLRGEAKEFRELLDSQGISLSEQKITKKDLSQSIQSTEALALLKLRDIFATCTKN